MMDKFQNKYRIPSARHPHWDYRWAGAYFITICTHNRIHYFGEIENGIMQLSPVGVIADILWHEIPHHAQNVELGAFVVMPNHVHGILILTGENTDIVQTLHATSPSPSPDDTNIVQTLHATSLPSSQPSSQPSSTPSPTNTHKNEQMADISPKSGAISTIIRSYKSAVTKHAHRLGFEFQWQTRFHDHIIRNDESFQKISNYIINNPTNWQDDTFFQLTGNDRK